MSVLKEIHRNGFSFHYGEDNPSGRTYAKHCHFLYEAYYLIEGAIDYIVAGETYSLTSGSLLLIPPCVFHQAAPTSAGGPYRRAVMLFAPPEGKAAERPLLYRGSPEIAALFGRLISYADTLTDAVATNFCIGVAGYPEKHHEAPNPTRDIECLKEKIEAGADYVVTQMFFDNQKYFTFVEKCRAQGITVPIIPGLKPLSTLKHLDTLPRSFSIDIPEELEHAIRHCDTPRQIKQLGIEWCVHQSMELLAHGAPAIHYYSMGKSDNIQEIVKRVF